MNELYPSHVPKAFLTSNIPQLKSNQSMVIVMNNLVIISFNTEMGMTKIRKLATSVYHQVYYDEI